MSWSTRQLAELAGTTVKAVRHYHQVGLLEEPERATNGYKQYGVPHLVRLLRIKRLADLGVPLAQIAALGDTDDHPEEALRLLDAELAASIEKLQRVRAELGVILRHRAPIDLPPDLGEVSGDLPDADRALVLVYSRILGPEAMDGVREMLRDSPREPADVDLDALPADADEATRQELAERLAPSVRDLVARYPWITDPGARSPRGSAYVGRTIGQAIAELYNPAQVDVLRRVHDLLADQE